MENYKKAFKEVDEIFKIMPESFVDKIPNSFKKLISSEMDINYEPNIKEPLEEVELLVDTKIILGLIYRDFLCSVEERKRLQKKDSEELQKNLEEIQKKYDVSNIFKNDIKNEEKNKTEIVALQVVQEEKWYKKIINKIKSLFNK